MKPPTPAIIPTPRSLCGLPGEARHFVAADACRVLLCGQSDLRIQALLPADMAESEALEEKGRDRRGGMVGMEIAMSNADFYSFRFR